MKIIFRLISHLYRKAFPETIRIKRRNSILNPKILKANILVIRDRNITKASFIPIKKRLAGPDRIIRKGKYEGQNCYYKTALLNTLIELKPLICLEIGTHYGGTTKVFQHYFEKYQPDGKLITTDIKYFIDYPASPNIKQVIIKPYSEDSDSIESSLTILKRELENINHQKFDFTYIDGDHKETSFLKDIRLHKLLSKKPHYALLDDTKDEAHESCFAYKNKIINDYNHYEFDDWPFFIGTSLIYSANND
tara:strand:+ start:2419 stop:3168 length:750 start_codon:yes stop_codon:yes gene_type:complete